LNLAPSCGGARLLPVKKGGLYMLRWLDNIEEYILVILFPLMVIIVFVATCVRYLTTGSIPWAEEVARYCMVWIGYIGASLGLKRNAHLGVEALVMKLPTRVQPFFGYLRIGIILLFNVLIAYFTYQIIQSQIDTEQISPALRIPIWFAYGAIPVGMILMSIRCIQALGDVQKALGTAPSDPSQIEED
jgi:TRAP-type C4-dicarboxylate transport system permease small subunit